MSPHVTLPDRLGYLLEHISGQLHRQSDQTLQERLGVGMSQLNIMTMLQDYPETSQRRLAGGLGQTEAAVSRQIKLLADKNLVAVKIDPAERRRRIIALTPRGIKLAEAAREVLAEKRRQVYQNLNVKQKEQLLEIFETMHEITCPPNKPRSCDRPYDLLDMYTQQRQPS